MGNIMITIFAVVCFPECMQYAFHNAVCVDTGIMTHTGHTVCTGNVQTGDLYDRSLEKMCGLYRWRKAD